MKTFSRMLLKLEAKKNLVELPMNLRDLLIAEKITPAAASKFVLRENEKKLIDNMLALHKVSSRLYEIGLQHFSSGRPGS